MRESTPKTRRGVRQVAIDAATVSALREWRRTQISERLAFGEGWHDSEFVFTREDGTPLHPESVSKQFNRHVRLAGLRRIRLHDLRHTHATIALRAGVHPKTMSERLGHATVAITMDTYTHAIPALQEEAAELIAGLVSAD
jgi:integrase